MKLNLNIRNVDGVSVVDLSGRLVLGEEAISLRQALNDLLAKDEKKILLNLAGIGYVDTSGLGTLVTGLASATSANAQLKLVNLDRRVHDVIRTTRLHMLFEVFVDEAKAICSFASHAGATG